MIIRLKYIAYVTKVGDSKEVTVGMRDGTQINLELSKRDKFIKDINKAMGEWKDFIKTEDYE